MQYVALALAPGLAIILFILYKDRYNKEPRLNLTVSFLLGCASIFPAIWFEQKYMEKAFDGSVTGVAIMAYGIVGFSEEISKFIGLRFYSYRQRSFDEPFDGIVYSVMVSMGFATIENLMYVLKYAQMGQGIEVGLKRMFLSVPAHATFAVVMGYFVGKAKFDSKNSLMLMIIGIAGAIFFHGTYDFFLFLPYYSYVGPSLSQSLLVAGAIVSLIVAIWLSRKLIRQHRNLSEELFKDKNTNISV